LYGNTLLEVLGYTLFVIMHLSAVYNNVLTIRLGFGFGLVVCNYA